MSNLNLGLEKDFLHAMASERRLHAAARQHLACYHLADVSARTLSSGAGRETAGPS